MVFTQNLGLTQQKSHGMGRGSGKIRSSVCFTFCRCLGRNEFLSPGFIGGVGKEPVLPAHDKGLYTALGTVVRELQPAVLQIAYQIGPLLPQALWSVFLQSYLLVIQLCFQTILHELGNGLLEQILDIIHTAYVCHLQQFIVPSSDFTVDYFSQAAKQIIIAQFIHGIPFDKPCPSKASHSPYLLP